MLDQFLEQRSTSKCRQVLHYFYNKLQHSHINISLIPKIKCHQISIKRQALNAQIRTLQQRLILTLLLIINRFLKKIEPPNFINIDRRFFY